MTLSIETSLVYHFDQPTDFMLQIEAAILPEQRLISARIECTPGEHFARVPAQEHIGDRIWLRHDGEFRVDYAAKLTIGRKVEDIASLGAVEPHKLPGEAVDFMLDSRYCDGTGFQPFVEEQFGHLSGGGRIAAMRDWIVEHFHYVPGSSDMHTTATDSFMARRGVCRDYAHVLVAFARASAIPARYVSGYGPDVSPQDFHAVAEVFLADPSGIGGTWQIVDPTGMVDPHEFAKIAVGRDAADAGFMTSYGYAAMTGKDITVRRG
ncbi:transglutaminase family protein [Novosphingobium sp. ZN18A2]|uniref:transglutaminase-like domain-containing protein n=1 Tax=Novosphingobium sp. ZN18A2 TaxID=3079861 RepID=UPI0030CCC273